MFCNCNFFSTFALVGVSLAERYTFQSTRKGVERGCDGKCVFMYIIDLNT